MQSILASLRGAAFPALLLATALPAAAQIPEEFTNLKLLDKDIERRQLIGTMRSWAGGLGVRCNHCHVGPDNLQGMDFASDEKPTKRAARVMFEMSRAINRQHLANLEGEERQMVTCFTCHRGHPKPPRNLFRMLAETLQSEGVEAAMTRYQELKEEFYGAGVYDFRERTLASLAQAAAEAGEIEAAIAVLESSLEIFPGSIGLEVNLGMAKLHAGDAAGAEEVFTRVLAVDPENPGARHGMQAIEKSRSEAAEEE